MKVILKEDVEKLGEVGKVVTVADGYARNYLIPKGLAMEATPGSVKVVSQQAEMQLRRLNRLKGEAEVLAGQIAAFTCTIRRKVGEHDKLFGSVTTQDIAESLSEAGIQVDRRKLVLDESIKTTGSYLVPIKLHPQVVTQVQVEVVPE